MLTTVKVTPLFLLRDSLAGLKPQLVSWNAFPIWNTAQFDTN